jgi:hypothetical protein
VVVHHIYHEPVKHRHYKKHKKHKKHKHYETRYLGHRDRHHYKKRRYYDYDD